MRTLRSPSCWHPRQEWCGPGVEPRSEGFCRPFSFGSRFLASALVKMMARYLLRVHSQLPPPHPLGPQTHSSGDKTEPESFLRIYAGKHRVSSASHPTFPLLSRTVWDHMTWAHGCVMEGKQWSHRAFLHVGKPRLLGSCPVAGRRACSQAGCLGLNQEG